MKKKHFARVMFIATFIVFPISVFSQSFTISTRPDVDTVSGIYGTGDEIITFNIENTNDTPIILTQVEMIFNYAEFFSGTIPTLWYSSTSLAGLSIISETEGWIKLSTGNPVPVIEYNYYPLFQNLAFTIPEHTQYRFCVESSKGMRQDTWVSSAPDFTTFIGNGVTLRVGSIAPDASTTDSVGCGGQMPVLYGSGAFFAGRITLEPATTTPVTLLNLTATYNNKNANIINWQTSQELNSKNFTIQKAYTVEQFTNLATLPAAGNSSTVKNYTYTDNNIEYKPTYYRLLQTDIDGKTAYSKTVMVNPYKNGFGIGRLYPNPAHNNIIVEYNSNNNSHTTLSITDMLGRQVQKNILSSVSGFNKQQINVAALAKGKYTVTLINNGQTVQAEFVKE
jgi:hypothetical protein